MESLRQFEKIIKDMNGLLPGRRVEGFDLFQLHRKLLDHFEIRSERRIPLPELIGERIVRLYLYRLRVLLYLYCKIHQRHDHPERRHALCDRSNRLPVHVCDSFGF